MLKKFAAGLAAVGIGAVLAVGLAAPANAGIQLWEHANYGSYLDDFGTGTSYVGAYSDNKASSLKVGAPANYAILYQFRDYGGCYRGKFYVGYKDLAVTSGYAVYGGCVGFNDRTSNIG